MSIGVPGCPDLACSTMSMHSPRMVLIHSESRSYVATTSHLLHVTARQVAPVIDHEIHLRGEFASRCEAHETGPGFASSSPDTISKNLGAVHPPLFSPLVATASPPSDPADIRRAVIPCTPTEERAEPTAHLGDTSNCAARSSLGSSGATTADDVNARWANSRRLNSNLPLPPPRRHDCDNRCHRDSEQTQISDVRLRLNR